MDYLGGLMKSVPILQKHSLVPQLRSNSDTPSPFEACIEQNAQELISCQSVATSPDLKDICHSECKSKAISVLDKCASTSTERQVASAIKHLANTVCSSSCLPPLEYAVRVVRQQESGLCTEDESTDKQLDFCSNCCTFAEVRAWNALPKQSCIVPIVQDALKVVCSGAIPVGDGDGDLPPYVNELCATSGVATDIVNYENCLLQKGTKILGSLCSGGISTCATSGKLGFTSYFDTTQTCSVDLTKDPIMCPSGSCKSEISTAVSDAGCCYGSVIAGLEKATTAAAMKCTPGFPLPPHGDGDGDGDLPIFPADLAEELGKAASGLKMLNSQCIHNATMTPCGSGGMDYLKDSPCAPTAVITAIMTMSNLPYEDGPILNTPTLTEHLPERVSKSHVIVINS